MHMVTMAAGILKVVRALGSIVAAQTIEGSGLVVLLDVRTFLIKHHSRECRRNVDRTSRLAFNVASKVGPVPLKVRMIELPTLALRVSPVHCGFLSVVSIDLVESVHIQLADKTLPVVMLEELWKDRVGKLDTVEDIKHIAFLGP